MSASTKVTESTGLVVERFGNPLEVASIKKIPLALPLKPTQVLLKVLCTNINPSDVHMIQGTYGVKHQLPRIFGGDLACEVVELGSDVKNVAVGDRVIPMSTEDGAWQTHLIAESATLYKIKVPVPATAIAQLRVNPLTAIQMLDNYVELKAGDYLIQNGATSAVAIFVMQLCKKRGVNTINVFRSRNDANGNDLVRKSLAEYGSTHAVTDDELAKFVEDHPEAKCKLGLSCLTGENVTKLNVAMAPNSTMVVYGSMDTQPLILAPGDIIFKMISVKGYWLHPWYTSHAKSGRMDLVFKEFDRVMEMFHTGELRLNPIKEFALEDWKQAFESSYFRKSSPDGLTYKAVLKMD